MASKKNNKLAEPTIIKHDVIKMAALGRPVYLGQLYDAIKDFFVGKIQLFQLKHWLEL